MFNTATTYRNRLMLTNSLWKQAIIVFFASLALVAASQISIPWQPVPLTFQSAMVVLLGLALGPKRASAAVALYLFEGAIGIPVFANFQAGIAPLLGPTGGYLVGFLPAAFLAGFLMEKGMAGSWITTLLTAFLSASVIFACGVLHLQTLIGWHQAWTVGVAPFLLIEPIKLVVASALAKHCWNKK